jgi:hypothetical protein
VTTLLVKQVKRLGQRIRLKTIWLVMAGLLPGVIIGLVIGILGLITLAPEVNLPPAYQGDSPGDVTVQVAQSYINTMTSQNMNGTTIPLPPPLGPAQLVNSHAQTVPGDQLLITAQMNPNLTGPRQVLIDLQPCVSSGRPAFAVNRVLIGGQDFTTVAGPVIAQKIASSFPSISASIPHEHLSRIQTTQSALILIYSSSGSGGQPACHSG